MVNQSHKLLGSVRYGNIVVLTFASFLGKVFTERRIPITNEFGGIEKSISQIPGTTFFHMRIAV